MSAEKSHRNPSQAATRKAALEYANEMYQTMQDIAEQVRRGLAPCGRTLGTAAPFPLPGVRCSCGEVHVPDPDFHCQDHATWTSDCHRCQDARIFGWATVSIRNSRNG